MGHGRKRGVHWIGEQCFSFLQGSLGYCTGVGLQANLGEDKGTWGKDKDTWGEIRVHGGK